MSEAMSEFRPSAADRTSDASLGATDPALPEDVDPGEDPDQYLWGV
jgi:hypothetical protein